MVFDIHEVSGIGEFSEEKKTVGEGVDKEEILVFETGEGEEKKVFLVERKNTIEVRTDPKLAKVLREKYESVMESRYFGRGGIEIVMSGQLKKDEVDDLVRLSYNLTSS